jgi:poly(A) polymerase
MTPPLVIPRTEHNLSRRQISPDALRVLYRLRAGNYLGYLAGGGVRDLLLGRRPKDFDVVTDATPKQVKRLFSNCRIIGRRFRLAHVFFGKDIIEVATFRADSSADVDPETPVAAPKHGAASDTPVTAPGDAHHPARVRTPLRREDGMIVRDNIFGSPEDDARRRDFTINALFYNIADFSIIDYVGGLADLRARMIRSIGPPAERYVEDPVRMVRAIRFAAMLDLDIEEETYRAIGHCRQSLAQASNARMYEEVLKLFLCGEAERAFDYLGDTGLRKVMFPQWAHWIESPHADDRMKRARQACHQIDSWVRSGQTVRPALLLATLFEDYHLARAEAFVRQGIPKFNALDVVSSQHFSELADRVFVPRKIGDQIAHLLAGHGHVESAARPRRRR